MTPIYVEASLSRRSQSGTAHTAPSNGHAADCGDDEKQRHFHGNSIPEGEAGRKKNNHDHCALPFEEVKTSRVFDNSILSPGVKLNQILHDNCRTWTDAGLQPTAIPSVNACQ